jgi:bifunctional non-homologous end joining protein LigD
MAKKTYQAKRNFDRTPEPSSVKKRKRKAGNRFVVQRHEARRLHYDFRLEAEGVLLSWAVPKGFSYNPKDKRLAVRTEDHPLEYLSFEGVIPKGEYGAGTVKVWDRGTFELLKHERTIKALDNGELKLRLRGQMLRGEWHLVRTRDDNWLLFKAKDRYATDQAQPSVDFSNTAQKAFPSKVGLMRPHAVGEPFSDPQWLFEAIFDGIRLVAYKRDEQVELKTNRGRNLTAALSRPAADLERVKAENAVLDGIAVALDENNRPSRTLLEAVLKGKEPGELYYYAFDLLYFEQWDLAGMALADRKTLLSSILPPLRSVLFLDHVAGEGEALAASASVRGLRSIIAKRASSPYSPGRSKHWIEIPIEPEKGSLNRPFTLTLSGSGEAIAGSNRIRFTNLQKVFWPKHGYTKGDLLEYYSQVAEFLLPYLKDRPIHMLRYPNGVQQQSFYQKQVPDKMPDWITTCDISSKHGKKKVIRSIVCNDRSTLLYMINLGSIDLHPWLSRISSLESPDWTVLDLDGKSTSFGKVVKIAREAGKLLRGIGLSGFPKTSGATGIHIFIPLRAGYSYEQSRLFCESIARLVASQNPEISTIERAVASRHNRVYIDFLQNSRGQTIVPPYVVRPTEDATVSMPLEWDELDSELSPSAFSLKNALERISQRGDLFKGIFLDHQDLMPAISELERLIKG